MTTTRVIAYCMHEDELQAATSALSNSVATDSYVVGEIEEADIADLERRGIVVERMQPQQIETAAQARRSMAAYTGVPAWEPEEDLLPLQPGVSVEWLAVLDGPLLPEWRQAIEATQAELLEALPTFTLLMRATPEQALDLEALPFVTDITRYGREVTGPIALTVEEPRAPEAPAQKEWDLWLADARLRPSVLDRLQADNVEVVGSGGRKIRVRLRDEDPRRIQEHPGVLQMVEYVPPQLHNDISRDLLGLGQTSATAGNGVLPYTGAGQVVAVADTGLDDAHPDFQGRIVALLPLGRRGNASDPIGHGTHVAGSILGDGAASDGDLRGVAPGAQLYFQSLLDPAGGLGGIPVVLGELFDAAYQAGARIHNNSWGSTTASTYTIESSEVDEFVAGHRDMLIVISAGNDGTGAGPLNAQPGFVDWLSIGSPASCKNALTVGASRSRRTAGGYAASTYRELWADQFPLPPIAEQTVSGDPDCLAAFSSRGPCDDRRIKPDVVAPGTDILSTRSATAGGRHFWGEHAPNPRYAYMGGTSMAAPLVSGCAALVREYYVAERGVQPSAALLKATLINGTRWLGGADALADHAELPNYHQGFGAVHLPTTLPNGAQPDLRLEFLDTWQDPGLQMDRTGDRFRFQIDVEAGTPLRICLAYTDLPGRGLQNDLSLFVQDPDGRKWIGNADVPQGLRIPDPDNNVELVRFEEPSPGRYLVMLFARNLLRGPQDFALVVAGHLSSGLRRFL